MNTIYNVILCHGGPFPLFVWCIISVAIFCCVCAGVVRRLPFCTLKHLRSALICLLLLIWSVHFFILLYTGCQIAKLRLFTNWGPGCAPSNSDIFTISVVSLMLAFVAGVLLLCASFVAVFDSQHLKGGVVEREEEPKAS